MAGRRKGATGGGARDEAFPAELRERLLLWCDRHCCLCKKPCGIAIEVHHIVPRGSGGSGEEDNAIPLCFDCHAAVGHYNAGQPRGTKYRPDELRKRRDQIYEEFTRHLVPALGYKISGKPRVFPDVGFSVVHLGGTPSIRLAVALQAYVDGAPGAPLSEPLYCGERRWNLNPTEGVQGHFAFPSQGVEGRDLRVGIEITIYDAYGRGHPLYPVTYVFEPSIDDWWLDPVSPDDIPARVAERIPHFG